MTENQKYVLRKLRRIRNEPLAIARLFFVFLLMFLFVTLVVLTWDERTIDNVTAVMLTSSLFIVLFATTMFVRRFLDTRSLKIMREADIVQVMNEIEDGRYYRSLKIFLTRDFIIGLQLGMFAIRATDILLIYKRKSTINYIPSHFEIVVKLRSGQEISLAECSFYSPKNRRLQDELIRAILEKNPKILVGFTNDNLYACQKEIVLQNKAREQ